LSIPVNAKVRAVPNFLAGLRAAQAFMVEQDAASASARFKKLQAELIKARNLLSFAPASGRPARFLDAKTGWGQFQAQQALQLAQALGMPKLRELVLARHVVLYAHSEKEVLLLSLRHERQLGYQLPGHGLLYKSERLLTY
jgi:hypothetical protein